MTVWIVTQQHGKIKGIFSREPTDEEVLDACDPSCKYEWQPKQILEDGTSIWFDSFNMYAIRCKQHEVME